MSKDAVEKAIKKGVGDLDGKDLEEIRYEGYAQGGVALIIDCLSDNRNRTVSEVRHALNKRGGNLANSGAVQYMFERLGVIVASQVTDEEKLFDIALEQGADDIEAAGEGEYIITCQPAQHLEIFEALQQASFNLYHSEVGFKASNEIKLDEDEQEKVLGLIDALEELDDVQDVYSNLDLSGVSLDSAEDAD